MNEELTIKFLEEIGAGDKVIANLKEPEEGLNVDELAKEFNDKQREVYANDPDVVKDLEVKATGKARGSVERELKRQYEISQEEWEENKFSEEKDYKKIVKFGIDKIKKQSNKTAQEIQDELQDANTKIKWYEEEEIPRRDKEWQNKFDRTDIERHFRKLIGDSGDLIVSHDVASTVLEKRLIEKGFRPELTEDRMGIIIKTKDGLMPQDEKKTRNLTNAEVVKGILSDEKLIKESHADDTPPPPPKFRSEPPAGGQKDEPPGMAAARANLEKVEKLERVSRK